MKMDVPTTEISRDQATTKLDLSGGNMLVLSRSQELSNIEILDPQGRPTLSVLMTKDGPVLKIGGAGLRLDVSGELSFSADKVRIEGREEVEIVSGGDIRSEAVGRSYQDARSHEIVSDLGDIRLKANDDVRLNGERVMVNCPLKDGPR